MGMDVYAHVQGSHNGTPCLVFAPAAPFAGLHQELFFLDDTPMFRWSQPLRRLFIEKLSPVMVIDVNDPPRFTDEQLLQAFEILNTVVCMDYAESIGVSRSFYIDMMQFLRVCLENEFTVCIH
jgi:hypothetical protein